MAEKETLLELAGDTGTIPKKELEKSPGYPSKDDLRKGPIAVIECTEEIPCNPCETVCKKGAITVGKPITNLPKIDPEKCNGCGLCIPVCPGLAIFIVDVTYSKKEAALSFPHEYFPLPKKGDEVEAVNRKGEVVCKGKVIRIQNPKSYDHTPVVTISIPKEYINEVRGIKLLREDGK